MKAKRLFLASWLVLTAGVFLSAAEPKKEKDKSQANSLQGNWKLTGIEEEGKVRKLTSKDADYFELKITGDKITVHHLQGGKAEEATFKLGPDKTPKTIDIMPTTGDDKGKTLLGIYELNGKELKLCVEEEPNGDDRPRSFKSKSTDVRVFFLQRDKS